MNKLTLDYPLHPYWVSQKFGASEACTENNNLPITKRKVTGKVLGVCLPGYVELYPLLGMKGHTGLDMLSSHGQTLYYCGPEGVVEEIQTEPERGLGLGIVSNDKFEFAGGQYQAKTRYWHLMSFNVKLGDTVKTGDIIGQCDNTGLSSGDHLHFELKPVAKSGAGGYYNVFQNNGYFGAVDPLPYFSGVYAMSKRPISSTITFSTDLKYGDSNEEVKRLQAVLNQMGYFTYPENTGNYREITRKAVYNFQNDYVDLSSWEKWILKGKSFGPKTRVALNKLIK